MNGCLVPFLYQHDVLNAKAVNGRKQKRATKARQIKEEEVMDKIKAVFCVLFGHSNIQDTFFGYYNCARCGDQVGDSLASVYPNAANVVIVGHNCDTCRENYKRLTWKDKVLAPNPFKDTKANEEGE